MIRIPSRSTVCLRWEFHAPHRGVFPTEEARLETSFPFGMIRASRRVGISNRLVVWPASTSISTLPGFGLSESLDDRRLSTRVGDHGDLLGTRDFRQGDSLRRVHWAQTARQQRTIVCERQAPEKLAVRLELDDDPAVHDSQGADCTWEQSLRVLASLAESLHRMQVAVECQLGDHLLPIGSAPSDVRRLLDLIAHLPARDQLSLESVGRAKERSNGLSNPAPLTIRITTNRRTPPPDGETIADGRPSFGVRAARGTSRRSLGRRRRGNEMTLSIALAPWGDRQSDQESGQESDRLSDGLTRVVPYCRPSPSHRTLTARAESLSEELPRVWRSLCHVG